MVEVSIMSARPYSMLSRVEVSISPVPWISNISQTDSMPQQSSSQLLKLG